MKTLETTGLRRENNMLKNHIKTLELSTAPTSLGSMAREDPLRWHGLTMGGEETTRRPPALHIQACKLKKRMQRDTFQQSLLVTMMPTAMLRYLPLRDLSDVRLDVLEQQAAFDTGVLNGITDLLRWLQLDREVVLLAAIYLIRFNASDTFPKTHHVWQQLLVAPKFAQANLCDKPTDTWCEAIP